VAIHGALIWGACAIVVLVVASALAGRTASTWPLAVTALTFSLACDASAPGGPDGVLSGDAPAAPSRRAGRRALAVVVGFKYRAINNRSESPPWTAVAAATLQCQKPGMGDHGYRRAWWLLQIPSSRV
jgi:hypothetical protein